MDLRDILLVGHILGVVVMAFGSGSAFLSSVVAGSNPDLRTIANASRVGLLGGRVTMIAATVVLLLGVWLVIENDWDFGAAWLSASFLLWLIAMGVGGGVMARHERKLLASAEAHLAQGESTNAAVLAEWNAPITKIAGTFLMLMYPAFLFLMVVKPGQ